MTTPPDYLNGVVLDFETQAIENRPAYPPEPVGVSIWTPSYKPTPTYLAWGHPRENNANITNVMVTLRKILDSGRPMIFHNAKFDLAVWWEKLGLPLPEWKRVHDTLLLLFLHDPHAPSLSLKPSAARLLAMPPDEQDAVRDWLIDNRIVRANDKAWGAHIAKAPGELVGRYANGDTLRTWELMKYLMPKITAAGMVDAYNRERRLLPDLLAAESRGIRADLPALQRATELGDIGMETVDRDISHIIRLEPELFDKREQLARHLLRGGFASDLPTTKTGKLSTTRDALHDAIHDPALRALFEYRGALKTCVSTFLHPWLESATANKGRLHPSWNQTRGEDYGTRTGRLSSSNPNFQNIPLLFDLEVPPALPPLPNLRAMILPEEGELWLKADFHSQEIRMLAHFAGGALEQMYLDNPEADAHQVAADMIHEKTGLKVGRKETKIVAFSLIYGAGVATIAARLGIEPAAAQGIKDAYMDSIPGVRDFQKDINAAAREGSVVSWGGRDLTAPFAKGGQESGERRYYALLNYLIQGSSADFTKEALVRLFYWEGAGQFLSTVHDEINCSIPAEGAPRAKAIRALRDCMEGVPGLSVPMRSEMSIGFNWGELTTWK